MSRLLPIVIAAMAFSTTAQAQEIPSETVWRLETVAGEPIADEVTLRIDADGSVGSNASCNQYAGQNTAILPAFALGPVAATQMLCPDMTTEQAYLAALAQVTRAEIEDGHLVLSDADGSQMVFSPVE